MRFKSVKFMLIQFIRKIIPSPKSRMVLASVFVFLLGTLVCTLAFSIAKSMQTSAGVGGLETTGIPQFASDETLVENAEAAETNADTIPVSKMKLTYFTYRVKKGDMIGIIADEYNITQDTIISVNSIRQSRLLQVGQYLKIPSIPGILYTVKNDGETPESISKKFEVDAQKCALVNSVQTNTSLVAGASLFIPDAELDWVTRQEINGDLFHRPIRARYYISSYYGWRKSPFSGARSFHTGTDFACPQGTSIYAALPGKVTTVAYNSTYGNYVIITHHSGYKTLYGHMSKQLVVRGQYVDANTRIGKVGSTGLSTGPHLHFTVFKWNKTVNPLGLLK